MRCINSKRSNVMIWMEPNEKLQNYVIKFMWEVIYAYFYNWDGSLFLVLIVYDLVELIIKASHQTKDYLNYDTHTHHTSMFNECHIHLCDCTWLNVFHILNFCWSNTKRFLSVLIVFGKSFVFAKISKIMLPCSGDLVAGQSNRELTQKFFVIHWQVNVPVTKKT